MKKGNAWAKTVNRERPLLVVFSAPSGAGKSTIVDLLVKTDRRFCKSISATTRKRRRGERQGRDYFYLTLEEFWNKKARQKFIETATVFQEWYNTPKQFVLQALARGKTVLFDIDIQGGMAVKKWRKDAVLIFIVPPSLDLLRKRLIGRKSESADQVKLRLGRALKEIKFWSKYDYVVCNDDLAGSVDLIRRIIRAESQRANRFQPTEFNHGG